MKNIIIASFCVLMFSLMSCEKDEFAGEIVAPSVTGDSEVYTINSRENKGFLLDELRLADFPRSDADFIIIPQTGLTGDVMSPFLSDPNLERRFILSEEFEEPGSALEYFESYNVQPEDGQAQQFALNLRPNQVWLVRTHSGKFSKILILETKIDKVTSFVEIKFKAKALV